MQFRRQCVYVGILGIVLLTPTLYYQPWKIVDIRTPQPFSADNVKLLGIIGKEHVDLLEPQPFADDNEKQRVNNGKETVLIFTYTHDNKSEIAAQCSEKYNDTFADNLHVIKNYPRGVADKYLPLLGDNQTEPKHVERYPVIVTGFDFQYYETSQRLFKSLHALMDNPKYNGEIKCLVYDLGMRPDQHEIIKKKSRCELRRFPFEEYPPHVKHLKIYAFKPILIMRAFMDYGFIWWMDSSMRINGTYFDQALGYLNRYGWIFYTNAEPGNDKLLPIATQTHPGMFKFLGEDSCKFRPYVELLGGNTAFLYNKISRIIVRAWASCALNQDCIAPKGHVLICNFSQTFDGRCHRYDQSMLGIMARRLYHEQNRYPLDFRLNTIFTIGGGDVIKYF